MKEIISAKDQKCFILVQKDANNKVGVEVLKSDPNKQSENEKLIMDLLMRQNLILWNGSDCCNGSITWHRRTINGEEKSILDYILVCNGLSRYLDEIFIDEDRLHTLTKYASTKGRKNIIESESESLSSCSKK